MVAFNSAISCKEAEAYYFEFLSENDADVVPRHIIDHVRGCMQCRSKIEQLDSTLSHRCSNSAVPQFDAAIGTMLKLHFAYLTKPVSCKTVTPFLPTLIDPSLEIRIPTPITAHLDHCQSCSENLERIRELNLSRGQLCRLSQMYADSPKDKYIACPKAQAVINDAVQLSFNNTKTEILKHLCLCSYCRELVYEARGFTIKLLSENPEGKEHPFCKQVSLSDIFDYAIPYGLDLSNDQYMKFRESLTAHLRKCPKCLGKIQDLHKLVFGIMDKPESGVVTVCRTVESQEAEIQTANPPETLYSGFPIQVEVSGHQSNAAKKQPVSANSGAPNQTRVFSIGRLAPLAKFGAVAAVLVIVLSLFFLTMPSAKAVTLKQIYEAVLKVKNVYMASFTPGKAEPVQKKWVSRSLGMYITIAGAELSIWDLNRGIRRTNIGEPDKTKEESLSPEETSRIKMIISGSLGLVPFENISVLPKDAKWHRLANAGGIPNVEVYDLIWSEKSYLGPLAGKKWRMYINLQTKLLQRIEIYRMLPGEQEYVLQSFKVIGYPTDNEIQTTAEKLCF